MRETNQSDGCDTCQRADGVSARELPWTLRTSVRRLGGLVLSAIAMLVTSPSIATCRAVELHRATSGADALSSGWADYKTRFVRPDGRIVDDANGNVSHSEGQGFGMLLAVGVGDEAVFERLWDWTRRELYRRPDGLASWRWVPNVAPHVADPNNATDGDLLVAWALLRASKRWDNSVYRAASRRIALAVGQHAVFQSSIGLALKPAVVGFGAADRTDGPIVNLSYWVFPALADLPEIAPEVDWKALTMTGLSLLALARFGPSDLPSDWISLAGTPAPAAGFPRIFGYDAVRVPLYLAWSGLGSAELYSPFTRVVQHGAVPAIVDLESGSPGHPFGEDGYGTVFQLAACAAGNIHQTPSNSGFFPSQDEPYFPSSLRLLSLLAAQDRKMECR